ncbi:DNA polymerase Y family protein [Streptomyces sp. CA-111067]|uniref:DNA polymerase Y family protein n=1 Tax=Streptomyces sp. CA-111067 TaxID=3240046 RepID=UPI003D9867B7
MPQQAAVRGAHVLHVRCRQGTGEAGYRALLDLACDVSPVVQVLPPTAALVDVAGALRYWDASPWDLGMRLRLRAAALLGIDVRVGAGPNWTVAAMASKGPLPVTLVPADSVAVRSFLDPLPVGMLHGIGLVQAERLVSFGLHSVGLLAATPEGTVQRILGGRAGRLLRDRALGIDPRPVTPSSLPSSTRERRTFDHDTLDAEAVRTALLESAVALGARLRARQQIAGTLALEVVFADGSTITRTRTLPEPSCHTEDLRTAAYGVFQAMDLQRARIRGITLTVDKLAAAGSAGGQISLDRVRENRLRAEPVIDELNARFGSGAVRPAALSWRRAG